MGHTDSFRLQYQRTPRRNLGADEEYMPQAGSGDNTYTEKEIIRAYIPGGGHERQRAVHKKTDLA